MKTRPATLGAILICISAALWGLDGVVLTPRLANLPVAFVVFLLHAIPFILMQPVLRRSYTRLRSMKLRGWLALALVSFTGGLLGTLAIITALFRAISDRHHVLVAALVLAAVLLKERVSLRFLGWSTIALVGAYLLTFGLSAPDATADAVTLQAALWAVIPT